MDRAGRGVKPPATASVVPHQAQATSGAAPILSGDTVEGRRVLGFTCTASSAPTADDDQLILADDEFADRPPRRSTDPADQPSLVRTGRQPDEQIRHARTHHPDDLRPGLADRFRGLLHGPRTPPFTSDLIEHLAGAGHRAWLSGGAPRDLLSGAAPDDIKDLDLTGTTPAGAFTETARQVLDLDGTCAEHPQRFSPDTLVCTVLDPLARTGGPSLDYRGLGLGLEGASFPATGTDLLQDSRQRDLTVNTLLYDPARNLVVDPSGDALDDLADDGGRLRLVPATTSADPLVRAEVLLRGLKFLLRWHDRELDDEPLRAWARALPPDLPAQLDRRGERTWDRLRSLRAQCVSDPRAPDVRETVRGFGTVASEILTRCDGAGS
ncbi:nucleotidyltransferase family protein [Streptomyces violarus]|uniref:hypothetical protein n=1 Tax=Streptomyces violarus TaxID=67380 RepID=UPI0021BEC442|nr:hypothetical protein [Streptomyces violarus]MCT9138214.1 hypothetical protein [Streptomyces violarus]